MDQKKENRNSFQQSFHNAHCTTPKRVKSLQSLFPSHCASAKQLLSEEKSQLWRVVGNIVAALTGPRFESQTSRFRDEYITA